MGNVEIPKWLKGLPLAPEFRPTDTEFADPVAYISKIERKLVLLGFVRSYPHCLSLRKDMFLVT